MPKSPRGSETSSLDAHREDIRDLPPSAKLVVKVLELDGPSTQSQLRDETLLPRRTVRYGLTRLEESGVIQSRPLFQDARKRLYEINPLN